MIENPIKNHLHQPPYTSTTNIPKTRTPTNPFYHLVYDLVISTPQPTQRVSQSQHFCENLQISTSTRTMEMSGRKCASKSPKCPVPAPNSTTSSGPMSSPQRCVEGGEVSVVWVAKNSFLQQKNINNNKKPLK